MKNIIIKILTSFQIFLLLIPSSLYPTLSYASEFSSLMKEATDGVPDSVCPTKPACVDRCKNIQTRVEKAKKYSCPSPIPGASGGPITLHGQTTSMTYDACIDAVTERFATTGPLCSAVDLGMSAAKWDLILASIYTGVGVACTAACIATYASAGIASALEGVCTGLDLAATSLDMMATISVQMEGDVYSEWYLAALGDGGTALATASLVGKGSQLLAKVAAKKVAGQITNNIDNMSEEALKTALKKSDKLNKAVKVLSCVSAGLVVAVAAAKWANYGLICDNAVVNCNKVTEATSMARGTVTGGSITGSDDLDDEKNIGSGGGPRQTSVGSGGSGGQGSLMSAFSTIEDNFATVAQSAATSGGVKDLMDKMTGLPKLKDFLNKQGLSLAQIGEKLQTQSPASVIASSIPNIPDDVKASLDKIDKLTRDGKIQLDGIGSTPVSGGGGGGGANKGGAANPFAGLGAKGMTTGAANTKSMEFAKKPLPPELTGDTDIWHATWTGSIFQIISSKLNKNKDKVDQLEWATPLNRALVGLPAKPESSSKSKVGGK